MTERAIADPTEHGWVDAGGGKWVWGGTGYDDTEIRGLIADNATAISGIDARVTTLEGDSGGGGLWTDNGDGTISFSGTAKAYDFVTT